MTPTRNGHAEGLAKAFCAKSGASTAAAIEAGTLSAVSYTHLRAHETVLDIVCRLLLEKKKTKDNNKKQN